MKIFGATIFVSILGFSNLAHAKLACQYAKITISESNIPLKKVFKKINEQTGLTVANDINETQLNENRKVTVNFKEAEITEVMSFLLDEDKDLTFLIKNKQVLIQRSNPILFKNINRFGWRDTLTTSLQVSGKVVDLSGTPISGASIRVKGTSHSTISNSDGTFHFADIEKGATIQISSIGFETKEIKATDGYALVRLKEHINILDEKIIIAYGSTTKRFNTGNIGSVKAAEIAEQPISNSLLAVQGRVPGVIIQQASGIPGSGVTIRIQGINSIGNGNDPFFVIDGVPYISQLLPTQNLIGGSSGVGGIYGNPLNYLNPNDVESIEILKDADATAIYGSRAANGAVLITTKKGKAGKLKTDVVVQSGWGKVGHMLNLLNTKDYLTMRHEALKNDGIQAPSDFDWDLNGTWDTTHNTNWQKELIGKTSQYTNTQLNTSGGNQYTQFFIGVGYNKQTTVYPGSFSDTKGSAHFNITNTSPNQKLKTNISGSYMSDINRLPMTDLTGIAIVLAPIAPPPLLPDGKLNWQPTPSGSSTYYVNPYAPLYSTSRNKTNNLTSNLTISYELIPGLEIKSSFGYNTLSTNEITKAPLTGTPPENVPYSFRVSTFINNQINSWSIDPYLNYDRHIGKGRLTMVVGANVIQQNSDQSSVIAYGFNNDLVMEDLGAAPNLIGSNINSVYKYNALYGRATYNWLEKYIINLTGRRDGSSRFGPQSQFHNFSSIGTAWLFSQEPFLQNALPFISFGKIRGSYGTTGNDQIGDYQFLDLYQSLPVSGTPYQNALGLTATRLNNPYLQWEETRKLQLGLEIGLAKDKILFIANYNRNRSSNQLIPFSLPITTGFQSILKNLPAVVQNTGWEFTVNTTNIKTRHFSWTTNFNLTIPKNKLLSFKGADSYNFIEVGQPLSMRRVFSYVGVNDTSGNYQYRDAKGNITYQPSDPADKTVIVNLDPKFYGGIQNSIKYKEFTLDFLFQFTKQVSPDNISYGILTGYPGNFSFGRGNQSVVILDRWQKPGDNATRRPFSTRFKSDINMVKNSDAVWSDASYIKLKTISLSWKVPDRLKQSMHVQDLRVFANAQNLFTITKYKGFDPEVPGSTMLPPLRIITFGLQLSL